MNKFFYFILIITVFFANCKPKTHKEPVLTKQETQQLLIDSQRAYIKKEDQMMDEYGQAHHWQNIIISGTGIRYWTYHQGKGRTFEEIKKKNHEKPIQVAIRYQSNLLDETPCYSATIDQPLIITVGESNAISGLHELVTYLRQGDRVKAIIPPRLAYGLAGDLEKIPPNSPVVYDLEILQWNY